MSKGGGRSAQSGRSRARALVDFQDLLAPTDAALSLVRSLLAARSGRETASDLERIAEGVRAFREKVEACIARVERGEIAGLRDLSREERHDLRTPLNHWTGYSEMLAEELGETGEDEELANGAARLAAWARNLLERLDAMTRVGGSDDSARGRGESAEIVRRLFESLEADEHKEADRAPGTILVVDDHPVNRDLLRQLLEREGHTIVEAADGEEALARLEERAFDAVLLDVLMPRLNGVEVLRRMRADERLARIPVVMLSALDEVDSAIRCIEAGAEDYVAKPFEAALLRARVGAALEKKRLRDRDELQARLIDEERRTVDRLLRALLPPDVAEELKREGRVAPRRVDDVAVLFADIVGFTRYCDSHAPEEVLGPLDRLVGAFEEATDEVGALKIKTIGDAYMASAGALGAPEDPGIVLLRLAERLHECAARLTPMWRLRVGVHRGPVVCGILGRRQFLFDVWGDTVNTAARMCQAAPEGRTAVTRTVVESVPTARFSPLGAQEIKGKGTMEVFLLEDCGAA